MLSIDRVVLDNNIFLAPMAGITDRAFRFLCKEQGCSLAYTEMVSAKGLYYRNCRTEKLLFTKKEDGPVAVQLFGSEPELMAEVASEIQDEADIIDINMGCPTPKIVKNGEGSALMKNPELAGKIIKKVYSVLSIPITVKIRKGWDESSVNAVEIARIAQDNGAAAVAVHGRTREQFYSGKADWEIIRQVKEAVSIPVIGNGDVFYPEDAARMMEATGCDAVMIGRGSMGNPWIFSQTLHFIKTGGLLPPPSMEVVLDTIKKQTNLMMEYKEEQVAVKEMRKHVGWYVRGFKNAAQLRKDVNKAVARDQLFELLNNYQDEVMSTY
ncbi:MAG: tRNA-dihydrouridine synthase DusB [Firmicutes bacterium]|nr:tRNA-dihydrouridine synthase DusB [Bacillota bacterium]MDI6707133.1 tRNA dihydrouridine synthase DusB [Bacillota bacterium]